MTSHEPEEDVETGGELDHSGQSIPLETLIGSDLEESEEEDG
jgi:hypothetical protein